MRARLDAGLFEIGVHERGVIAVGDEADLLAIGLDGDGEIHGTRQFAHLGLSEIAERKQRSCKLRLSETEQKVSLILGVIYAAQQFVAADVWAL